MPLTFADIKGLLGALSVISDGEINSRETGCLSSEVDFSPEGMAERDKIFSRDPDALTGKGLLTLVGRMRLNVKERESIVRLLVKVGCADGFYDPRERELTHEVAAALDVPEKFVTALERQAVAAIEADNRAGELTWHQRLRGAFDSLIFELTEGDAALTDDTAELLSGMGFARKIEEITRSAGNDLERVSEVMDGADNTLDTLARLIDSLHDKVSRKKRDNDADMEAVVESVQEVRRRISSIVSGSMRENREMLARKGRSIRYFTIAFMGRTKAGKSTLHKVVTHQKDDDIGNGQLRTTRFNRSWYWERLRVVDTPGIGAPGGASDRETAASIIDDADLICYIVTNDSIQPGEFDFLESIKERNKPLFIILNCRMNLDLRPRLKRFLDDPYGWRTGDGAQSLQGHFSRIRGMLEGKYNMEAVRIIPVQLIAALMHYNRPDEEFAATLLEGSNIRELIRAIKMTVYRNGSLLKTMSVIDGCAHRLHSVTSMLSDDVSRLREANAAVSGKRDSFRRFVAEEGGRVEEEVGAMIAASFAELRNRASTFAVDECENRNAGERWNSDPGVAAVYQNLEASVKLRLQEFSEKVRERIEEMVFDIDFVVPVLDAGNIGGVKIRNTRLIAGIAGTIGALAFSLLWSAVGWGMVVAFAIDAAVNMFKSRDKKRREAAARLEAKLIERLDHNERMAREGIVEQLRRNVADVDRQIDSLMSVFVNGVTEVIDLLDKGISDCRRDESTLNSLLGARILEYLCRMKEREVDKMTNREIADAIRVRRDWHEAVFEISCRPCGLTAEDAREASRVTQMNVVFKES